jgi:hypothetical protein
MLDQYHLTQEAFDWKVLEVVEANSMYIQGQNSHWAVYWGTHDAENAQQIPLCRFCAGKALHLVFLVSKRLSTLPQI